MQLDAVLGVVRGSFYSEHAEHGARSTERGALSVEP